MLAHPARFAARAGPTDPVDRSRMPRTNDELRAALTSGLLFFPITDFDSAGDLALGGYRARLEWLLGYRPSVMFAAAGAGAYFFLSPPHFYGGSATAGGRWR